MSKIPETWLDCRLGDVLDYGTTTKAEPADISADDWVLELEDIEKDTSRILQRFTFSQRQSKSTKNRFAAGDVLYGKLRPYLNKVVRADRDGFCTTEIVPLAPSEWLDGSYLFYWLKHPAFLDYVTTTSHGLNMPRLGTEAGRNAPFILAPLNEQKRIADKLDAVLAQIDACRERLNRVPAMLKRFRQSVLAAATSGKLAVKWRGDEVERRRIRLQEALSSIKTGPFGSALHKSDYVLDGTPVVNPMHIVGGKIVPTSNMAVNKATLSRLSEFRLAKGDVIIGRRGEMGRCAVVTQKEDGWLCGTGSMVLRPIPELDSDYLQLFLSSPETVAALEAESVGTTMVNLNQKILLGLKIYYPPKEEQQEIVRLVEELFVYADRLEARYATAQVQVEKLTPALLAKAFRGELVPQDPNDEPASVLLERIRAGRPQTIALPKPRARRTALPKAEVTMLTLDQITPDHLTAILRQQSDGRLDAKALWQKSQLEISDFYEQLKVESGMGLLRESKKETQSFLEAA